MSLDEATCGKRDGAKTKPNLRGETAFIACNRGFWRELREKKYQIEPL